MNPKASIFPTLLTLICLLGYGGYAANKYVDNVSSRSWTQNTVSIAHASADLRRSKRST